MNRRTPYRFEVVVRDGRVEQIAFYGTSKEDAMRHAEAWGRRLGVEVEPVEDGEAG